MPLLSSWNAKADDEMFIVYIRKFILKKSYFVESSLVLTFFKREVLKEYPGNWLWKTFHFDILELITRNCKLLENLTKKISDILVPSTKVSMHRPVRARGGQGGGGAPFWLINFFIMNNIIKRNWRIYSFKKLDSILLAQIVFKYKTVWIKITFFKRHISIMLWLKWPLSFRKLHYYYQLKQQQIVNSDSIN